MYRREAEQPPRRNCPAGGKVRGSQFAVRGEEEQAACRAVCQACEHFAGNYCRACRGCRSEKQAVYESVLRVGECPKGKWAPQSMAASQ